MNIPRRPARHRFSPSGALNGHDDRRHLSGRPGGGCQPNSIGLHLGEVSGLTSSPPSLCDGASGERLVVAVIINYGISP
jgi:hypothetical protein